MANFTMQLKTRWLLPVTGDVFFTVKTWVFLILKRLVCVHSLICLVNIIPLLIRSYQQKQQIVWFKTSSTNYSATDLSGLNTHANINLKQFGNRVGSTHTFSSFLNIKYMPTTVDSPVSWILHINFTLTHNLIHAFK